MGLEGANYFRCPDQLEVPIRGGGRKSSSVAQVLSSVANPSRYPDRLDVPAHPARALTHWASRLMRERFLAPSGLTTAPWGGVREGRRERPVRGSQAAGCTQKKHEFGHLPDLEALAPGAASLSGAPGRLPTPPSQGPLEPDPPEAQPPALSLLLSRAATWLILPVAYACLKD
ncbi:hypothetical protein SKAU_G00198490 [Synaphobranchus kaupii]|uniref:Uncharacterized protein n=1 Tax=Synaphobranchus kaupii TaxID=118154 RepID=A0A9Q1IY55_SYNKA|nr:hypothetical protein SKAU_G00198490 [Synaphobranchus kaupii]